MHWSHRNTTECRYLKIKVHRVDAQWVAMRVIRFHLWVKKILTTLLMYWRLKWPFLWELDCAVSACSYISTWSDFSPKPLVAAAFVWSYRYLYFKSKTKTYGAFPVDELCFVNEWLKMNIFIGVSTSQIKTDGTAVTRAQKCGAYAQEAQSAWCFCVISYG